MAAPMVLTKKQRMERMRKKQMPRRKKKETRKKT
jgi:hypothetical protein